MTRYEFQDGVYAGETCDYHWWIDGNTGDFMAEGEYADCQAALIAFFDNYQIRTSSLIYDYPLGYDLRGVFETVLSPENDMKLCFELTTRMTDSWYDVSWGYTFETVCRTENEWSNQVSSGTQEAASDTIPSNMPTEAQGEESTAQDGDSSVSYAAYQDILNEIHDGIIILYDEGFGSDNLPDAHFGSWDCIYNQYGFGTAEEALDSVGYTLQDFDGDGVDELVVGLPNGDILELYTLQNGAAVPLLSCGGYREVYWLAEDNIIYYQGSGGAAAGAIAAYHVTGNGVELIEGYDWDFTFSMENSVTHKTGGILSPDYGSVEGAETEMLTMDEDTFYALILDSFFTLPEKELELTPLSSL